MVGFFLAGGVGRPAEMVAAGPAGGLQPFVLFCATALTAITDNAALTLGSLVEAPARPGVTCWWRAPSPAAADRDVANAPNPAGFAIRRTISRTAASRQAVVPVGLGPTLAALMFLLPVRRSGGRRDRPQPAREPSGKPSGGSRKRRGALSERGVLGTRRPGRLRLFMKTAKIQDFFFLALQRGHPPPRFVAMGPPGRLPVVIWRTVFEVLIRRVRPGARNAHLRLQRLRPCGDVLQKISDAPLTVCPECGQSAFSKQVTAAGFQLAAPAGMSRTSRQRQRRRVHVGPSESALRGRRPRPRRRRPGHSRRHRVRGFLEPRDANARHQEALHHRPADLGSPGHHGVVLGLLVATLEGFVPGLSSESLFGVDIPGFRSSWSAVVLLTGIFAANLIGRTIDQWEVLLHPVGALHLQLGQAGQRHVLAPTVRRSAAPCW